jgi:hypothetical protein
MDKYGLCPNISDARFRHLIVSGRTAALVVDRSPMLLVVLATDTSRLAYGNLANAESGKPRRKPVFLVDRPLCKLARA